MFTRVSPTSKMSNICMRSCIGTLATFGWLCSLPGWIDRSVRFCFGSPGISVCRTLLFLETVGFQKRGYLYKKNMACELHWKLLDTRESIEILLITSNGIEILWFEQFFFLVPCKNTRDRMTNDRHRQMATKVKAHVETTVPLVVPLGPQTTSLSLGDQFWASIYLESISVPQCQWIVKMNKILLSSSMFFQNIDQ